MKRVLRYLINNWWYPFVLLCGIDKVLRLFSRNSKLIIFFHGVSSDNLFTINGRHLPLKDFEQLLQYFKSNFDVVSLNEICNGQNSPGRKTIALTFDDGFTNNLSTALPALQQLGLPATFFISTRSLVDQGYIHPSDFMDFVKKKAQGGPVEFNGETFVLKKGQLLNARNGQSVYHYLEGLGLQEGNSALDKLLLSYGKSVLTNDIPSEAYQLMSPTDITALCHSRCAAIGSHSHNHVNLSNLSRQEIRQELKMSKDLLEKYGSASCKILAFPYGEFNDMVIEEAHEAGFSCLLAGGDVAIRYSQKVFPRIGVANMRGAAHAILSINWGFRRFGF